MPSAGRGEAPRQEPTPRTGRNRRKRVVLADPSRPVTVLRNLDEVEEQTSVGEVLVRNLMRTQLKTALWLATLVVVLLGALPLAGYFSPTFAHVTVVGVRLQWLLLGVLPFPLLFGVGYWYHRKAEHLERDFVDMMES